MTKIASRGAHSPVRGHHRGSKVVPLNSWGRFPISVPYYLPLFDVFCKRSLNFINRCLVSDNVVVNFVARHGVFHSRMFSCIGRNFQFCCNRYRLRACDLVNRAHYEHVA